MKNIVPINKYLEFLEENHKKLVAYFDDLYKEFAQYEGYKRPHTAKKQLKKLDQDRKDAFTVYYANVRHFVQGEDVSLDYVIKKDNPIKRFFKKLFRIKVKETPVLVIEESISENEAPEDVPLKDEIISEATSNFEEQNPNNSNDNETNEEPPNEEEN